MGKRTDDRSVNIDVVPNGVAFNLAKSWLGLVKKKKDDDDDEVTDPGAFEDAMKNEMNIEEDSIINSSAKDAVV